MRRIYEFLFDAILRKLLKRYSAGYLALYLRYKLKLLDEMTVLEAETDDNRDV